MANAEPPEPRGQVYEVEPEIRVADQDLLRNDGSSSYAGKDSVAYIYDSFMKDRSDTFHFSPRQQRTYSLRSPVINDGTPVRCEGSRLMAYSYKTRSWFDQLDADKKSVAVQAWLLCSTDSSGKEGYEVYYPATDPNAAVDLRPECVRFTRESTNSFTLTAPAHDVLAPCKADIFSFVNPSGSENRIYKYLGSESAPFEMTMTLDS